MQLFDYCRSSAAYRVRIALNLKALNYTSTPINLVKAEQKAQSYKQTNPQGLVPALQDGDALITQSMAICEYLDEAYPDTFSLLPESAKDKAQVRALANIVACDVHPLNNLRVQQYLVNEMDVTDENKMVWYHHWIHEGFSALEAMLKNTAGKYCFGDNVTLADVCLVPQVFNANRFKVDLSEYPTLVSVVENCEKLEAFQKAHPNNQPDA
jgi:maleylacetoacetate isomerase/maleylpyruvate isomerase